MFRTRFLDGPARAQVREWVVGNPPSEIVLARFRTAARGEHWEMVHYSGLPHAEKPWPEQVTYRISGVDLSSADGPEIQYMAVYTEAPETAVEGLRVDVLYNATVYVTVELEPDLTGGRVVRVLTDDQNVEPVPLDQIGAVQRDGAGVNNETVRQVAAKVASDQTWPEWERGL